MTGGQEAVGSNPITQTKMNRDSFRSLCSFLFDCENYFSSKPASFRFQQLSVVSKQKNNPVFFC